MWYAEVKRKFEAPVVGEAWVPSGLGAKAGASVLQRRPSHKARQIRSNAPTPARGGGLEKLRSQPPVRLRGASIKVPNLGSKEHP